MTLGEVYKKVGEDGWRFVTDYELAMESFDRNALRRGGSWFRWRAKRVA